MSACEALPKLEQACRMLIEAYKKVDAGDYCTFELDASNAEEVAREAIALLDG
jgi:hypothetical protein